MGFLWRCLLLDRVRVYWILRREEISLQALLRDRHGGFGEGGVQAKVPLQREGQGDRDVRGARAGQGSDLEERVGARDMAPCFHQILQGSNLIVSFIIISK